MPPPAPGIQVLVAEAEGDLRDGGRRIRCRAGAEGLITSTIACITASSNSSTSYSVSSSTPPASVTPPSIKNASAVGADGVNSSVPRQPCRESIRSAPDQAGHTLRMAPSSSLTPAEELPPDAKVVYRHKNICVQPAAASGDRHQPRIRGCLLLVKQDERLFLSWIPALSPIQGLAAGGQAKLATAETGSGALKPPSSTANLSSSAAEEEQYTIRNLAISEVRCVLRYTPSLGVGHIIIVLHSGIAYPPLYFPDGGLRDFIRCLKEHAYVTRSADDPNVYLVQRDDLEPLHVSLATFSMMDSSKMLSSSMPPDTLLNSCTSKARDADLDGGWQDLSYARITETGLQSPTPSSEGPEAEDAPQADTDLGAFELVDGASVQAPTSLKVKARRPPLGRKEWLLAMDAKGRILDDDSLRAIVFNGGIEPSLRREIWPFLLGVYGWKTTAAEREEIRVRKRQEYHRIKQQWLNISEIQASRFAKFRERRSRIDKDVVRTDRSQPFFAGEYNHNLRVLRSILLSYSFYNFDLSYCQGMNDLLSPILYVMEDEADSFWCFAALMESMGANFDRDISGVHRQLYAIQQLTKLLDPVLYQYLEQVDCGNFIFCFRWLIVHCKRELPFNQVPRLWEALWTRHMGDHFHLFVCVAILNRNRRKIIEERMELDTLLQFANDFTARVDVETLLRDAQALYIAAGDARNECLAGLDDMAAVSAEAAARHEYSDVV